MGKYKVKDGYQVAIDDKVYLGGETFSTTEKLDDLTTTLVDEVGHSTTTTSEATATDKAVAAPQPTTTAKKSTAARARGK